MHRSRYKYIVGNLQNMHGEFRCRGKIVAAATTYSI